MISILLFGVFIVILSSVGWKNKTDGLKASVTILSLFLAVRYDFGNDYKTYYELFTLLNGDSSYKLSLSTLNDLPAEIGWCVLNVIFRPIGFYGFIFVLTLFEGYVLYTVIKKYVKPNYYWLAIFIFYFNPNLMLTGASAMRQWLAICIFLLSIRYIIEGNFIKYIICIVLACTFHTSAACFLPVYCIYYLNRIKNGPIVSLIMIVSFVVLYKIISNLEILQVQELISSVDNSRDYERYLTREHETSLTTSLIGIITLYTVPLVAFLRMGKYKIDICTLIIIYLFCLPVTALTDKMMMAVRINFYFWAVGIVAIPCIISEAYTIKGIGKFISIILIAIVILPLLRNFIQFFNDPTWKGSFDYQTILSAFL